MFFNFDVGSIIILIHKRFKKKKDEVGDPYYTYTVCIKRIPWERGFNHCCNAMGLVGLGLKILFSIAEVNCNYHSTFLVNKYYQGVFFFNNIRIIWSLPTERELSTSRSKIPGGVPIWNSVSFCCPFPFFFTLPESPSSHFCNQQ